MKKLNCLEGYNALNREKETLIRVRHGISLIQQILLKIVKTSYKQNQILLLLGNIPEQNGIFFMTSTTCVGNNSIRKSNLQHWSINSVTFFLKDPLIFSMILRKSMLGIQRSFQMLVLCLLTIVQQMSSLSSSLLFGIANIPVVGK